MPDINWNENYWNSEYAWPKHGEEWSQQWGNSMVQWWGTIFPRISQHLPTGRVVEIAPGQGRWTRFILNMCDDYAGFDLSANTVRYCNNNLARVGKATRRFGVNNGTDLPGVEDHSVDFVFSFDSLVHVEMDVVEAYIAEIKRVLRPGGSAFIHHSNLAMFGLKGDQNPQCRGESVSAERVRSACTEIGLSVVVQEMVNWKVENCQDCFTTIRAPGGAEVETKILYNNRFWDDAARARDVLGAYHRK